MTLELHPEEMLDAARRGTLGPQGFADLHAHLDRCAACRLSLALGDDLRPEAAVTGADNALLAHMVAGALAEPGAFAPVPSIVPARASDTGRFSPGAGRFARRAAIALALLFVGGSAGAAIWSAGGTRLLGKIWPQIDPLPQLPRDRGGTPPAASHPRAEAPDMKARVETAPAPEEAPALPTPPRPRARPAAPVAVETADDVFTDANRARRAGDYAVALRRYAQLRRQFPGTRQEMTARVIVGDLSFAGGETRDALASFDSYLAASPDGTLAEEARVGRALALQKLGRRDEERAAWKQLLRRHPDSVQVTRARDRLAELGE